MKKNEGHGVYTWVRKYLTNNRYQASLMDEGGWVLVEVGGFETEKEADSVANALFLGHKKGYDRGVFDERRREVNDNV